MSSVEHLRAFVHVRLTAAADEIFKVFQETIVEYEEEMSRQRRLLDVVWKPQIKLHRIELPQQHACLKVEEVVSEKQLRFQERSTDMEQEQPEPPQMKEEREELCSSQEREQHLLTQESDVFMETWPREESDCVEDQCLLLNPGEASSEAKEECGANMPVIDCAVSLSKGDHQGLSDICHEADSQEQKGSTDGSSDLTPDAEPDSEKSCISSTCGKRFHQASQLILHKKLHTDEFPCHACGKSYASRHSLAGHMGIHIGERSFSCESCGEKFMKKSDVIAHKRKHTSENQYGCVCGESFTSVSALLAHRKKRHCCKACGKTFNRIMAWTLHIKSCLGKTPFSCEKCLKAFPTKQKLGSHMKTHIDMPYHCPKCGKAFRHMSSLNRHLENHAATVDMEYICKTCGNKFNKSSSLIIHERIHEAEKKSSCQICGGFFRTSQFFIHMKMHTGHQS